MPKKSKLIWGIVIAFCGLAALMEPQGLIYILICIAMMAGGGLLIFTFARAALAYKKQLECEEEIRKLKLENEKERLRQDKEELARKKWKDENSKRVCPNCGAVVRGHYCEYCDSAIE